jgi:hypothetical protein
MKVSEIAMLSFFILMNSCSEGEEREVAAADLEILYRSDAGLIPDADEIQADKFGERQNYGNRRELFKKYHRKAWDTELVRWFKGKPEFPYTVNLEDEAKGIYKANFPISPNFPWHEDLSRRAGRADAKGMLAVMELAHGDRATKAAVEKYLKAEGVSY